MNKKIWAIVIAVAVLATAGYFLLGERQHAVAPTVAAFDPLNATYVVDGQPVTLMNGAAQVSAAPGSAEQVTTTVFGEPASGDLNGDGRPDAALIIVQSSGGSGTFYYAAAAINTANGADGTNAILLGDRIAPQNISIQDGQVVVNYADRNPGESMSVPPTLGVTKCLTYQSSTLTEVAPAAH